MHARLLLALMITIAAAAPAAAQFQGYFDVGEVSIAELPAADWTRRKDGDRLLFLCTNADACPPPTAIEIKGVTRAETLPAAFDSGPLSPQVLDEQGRANAARMGSTFISAAPFEAQGRRGVAMEAATGGATPVFFVTRWVGEGHRLLDIKVTSSSLERARALSDAAVRAVVPQVFK